MVGYSSVGWGGVFVVESNSSASDSGPATTNSESSTGLGEAKKIGMWESATSDSMGVIDTLATQAAIKSETSKERDATDAADKQWDTILTQLEGELGGLGKSSAADSLNECKQKVIAGLESCYKEYEMRATNAAQAIVALQGSRKGSIFQGASKANSQYQRASNILNVAFIACVKAKSGNEEGNSICDNSCDPNKFKKDLYPASEPNDQNYMSRFSLADEGGTKLMETMGKFCTAHFDSMFTKIREQADESRKYALAAGATANKIKIGAAVGGAAIVGGLLYKSHEDKKEEKEKREQQAANLAKGIAPDGTNCVTPDTFTAPQCKSILINYCSKSENANKPGCGAFNNHYCAASDAPQAYCLGNSARNYCRQSGDLIGQSPACQWVSGMPASCAKSPEDMKCLTNLTPAQLEAQCPNFPNDPLCQAHGSGKVVTQPAGGDSVGTVGASAKMASAGTGLNDIVGQVDQSSMASENDNLWRGNSAAYDTLCKRGQLVNCGSGSSK